MHQKLSKYITNSTIALFFFITGGTIAILIYTKNGYTFFYQSFVPESILWACGYNFVYPKQVIKELIPFLKGTVTDFQCGDLNNLDFFSTPGNFYTIQPYLTWTTAILWKWLGITYNSLTPLVFTLWGAYSSGIYLLFRQFFNKLISAGVALFICFSPVTAYMLLNLRDFSKAPFIIWAIYLLIFTIKEPQNIVNRRFTSPALAGIIAGLGMGFRSDLFFLLPIGTIFLFIGSSTSLEKGWVRKFLHRTKTAAIFSTAFIVFAFPILKSSPPSGAGGVFVMQGMSEPFRIALGLKEAGYTTGISYSDELTLSAIASNERLNNSDWDGDELKGVPGISISNAIKLGTTNLYKWGNLFLGDFTNQAIKSSLWITAFPLFISNAESSLTKPNTHALLQLFIYSGYKTAKSPVILIILIFGFISLLFVSYRKSIHECFAIAFLFIFLSFYPGLQFNLRHFFYLEFIWILYFLSFISLTSKIYYERKKLIKFIFLVMIVALLASLVYTTLIQYQKWALSKAVNELLTLPRERIHLNRRILQNKEIFMPIETPLEYRDLLKRPFDSMTPEMENIGSQWDVRSGSARYLLSISGNNCNSKKIQVILKYKKTDATWQPLDTALFIPPHPATKDVGLLFSAYYRPNQFFNGLSIPVNFSECNFKLEKIIGYSSLPFIFSANINQREVYGPLVKEFGGFDTHIQK